MIALNELLATFQPLPCWRFAKYLGSMLTLDFGDQIDVQTHDSTFVIEGSLVIGVRNAFWIAMMGERVITNSAGVDQPTFDKELSRCPIGSVLEEVSKTDDNRWISFRFANTFALNVDATNMWKTESDIFEITLPDGRIVVHDQEGIIEILDEVEPVRADRWRARLI